MNTATYQNTPKIVTRTREEESTALVRRRRANPIHLLSMARLIALFVIIGAIGLTYVGLKIKTIADRTAIAQIEREIHEVREDNRILEERIGVYTSRPYLEKRLAEGAFDLQPIRRDSLVQLPVVSTHDTLVSNVEFHVDPEIQVP